MFKKISTIILIIAVVAFGSFINPKLVLAAWFSVDDFESYTDTNNLATLNGGTDWAAAWALQAGTGAKVRAAGCNADYAGTKCYNYNESTASGGNYRDITAITTGVVSFGWKCLNNGIAGKCNVDIAHSTAGEGWTIRTNDGGDLQLRGSTDITILSSAGTGWYTIEVNFDTDANTATARAKPEGGVFGAYSSAASEANAIASVDRFQSRYAGVVSTEQWVDNILAGEAVGGAAAAVEPIDFWIDF